SVAGAPSGSRVPTGTRPLSGATAGSAGVTVPCPDAPLAPHPTTNPVSNPVAMNPVASHAAGFAARGGTGTPNPSAGRGRRSKQGVCQAFLTRHLRVTPRQPVVGVNTLNGRLRRGGSDDSAQRSVIDP